MTGIPTSTAPPSTPSVREQNRKIKWFKQTSLIPFARRALIYEVNSRRPQLVLLQPKDDFDPACGAFASTDDLDMDVWFGGSDSYSISSVDHIPGTHAFLLNGFDVVALRLADTEPVVAPANDAVERQFSLTWHGNLLVVKRGRYDRSRAISITPSEISTINALVECWLGIRLKECSTSDSE
ncbi:hypothetical protein OH77DRAFT_1515053 [Trametes cingulata]|nr:hypothetical protein OH77DRAFT_1515053 [Trametes cingulata]